MEPSACGGNGPLRHLLDLSQAREGRGTFAAQPTADRDVRHPHHRAKRRKRQIVLDEIMAKFHEMECTECVHAVQVACAELTPAASKLGRRSSRMHDHLRAWREASGLTLQQVANKLGTTHATVSRWESGLQAIHPQKFKALAEVYGATPAELLVAPNDREMAKRFHRAAEIISKLSDQEVEQWLGIGQSLAGREK
ncbi:MAG TPA: helix-turn-helix transcriptional regulator [Roseomonas sp.]|nr:helix-turn-helix transcriptional regulator [Roseomonas sp.]